MTFTKLFFQLGLLGRTVPPKKRGGVKSVLAAMKVICQSEEGNNFHSAVLL